jgi:YD repeat-containing protein
MGLPEKQTGKVFNLMGVIDNLINSEYVLPPGAKEEQFAEVREVAAGYKILGTTYKYNDQNQLIERHNLVRDEVHPYSYDDRGNLSSNGRIKYTWNN